MHDRVEILHRRGGESVLRISGIPSPFTFIARLAAYEAHDLMATGRKKRAQLHANEPTSARHANTHSPLSKSRGILAMSPQILTGACVAKGKLPREFALKQPCRNQPTDYAKRRIESD
jgi:hypothetical protein